MMKEKRLPALLLLLLVIFVTFLLAACGHQHAYGPWVTEKEPTCTADGVKVRTCECSEKETEILPAKGHTDGEWVTDAEATCTKSGSKHLTCSVCGETAKTETIPAKGHTDGEWMTDAEATCTKSGSKYLTCSVCGETAKTETIPAKGHTDGQWVTDAEATCTKSGSRHLTCSVCGETARTESIPALGHKDSQWVTDTEATCTKSGSKHLTCSVCGETVRTENIPALGHKDSQWVTDTEATCTKNGSKHQVCSACNATLKTESIPAAGHKDGQWITDKNATCTAAGSKHQVCSVCNATIKTESIPATGKHDYSETSSTAASCTGDGVKTFTCSGCGNSYTETIPSKTYSATEIYDNHLRSVGEVTTYTQSGSALAIGTCFVYRSDGTLITNYHVIENAYSATVSLGGVSYQVQQVLAYDKDIDLAVLKISASDLIPVKLCSQNHKVGEIVYAIGSSKGLTATFSDGIITYSNRILNGISYTQHDAPISGGNSGGPLINKYGEVIGINTWTVTESQNLNFAINVSELNKLSYNTPMTMAELYLKECDAFTRLKNYIAEQGTYSSSENCYSMVCDDFYLGDGTTRYTVMTYYYIEKDFITLDMLINDGESWLWIQLDNDLTGVYFWEYFDDNKYEMSGTLYAATYDDNTLLGYDYHNAPTAGIANSIRSLSSTMVSYIGNNIDNYFSAVSVTAKDLGFLCY